MKRTSNTCLLLVFLCCGSAAQTQILPQSKSVTQTYTTVEYNAYQAVATEKDPAKVVILVDDFVSRYPTRLSSFMFTRCVTRDTVS